MTPFEKLTKAITAGDTAAIIRHGVIGEGLIIQTATGQRTLVYADYVASGRALRHVEDVIRDDVLPYYANTHSESSYLGSFISKLREEARQVIADALAAPAGYATIFAGAGSTAALNQLAHILDVRGRSEDGRVVILVGPYEHHSNILPWRESGAEVIEIAEAVSGGPDLEHLERVLCDAAGADLVIGAFSAASNVTGTMTDTDKVTRILRRHGAVSVWDYACAAPYVPISVGSAETRKDAIVFSPHKFVGGPAASGILVVDAALAKHKRPSRPGGGTVEFVSPWGHSYSRDLVQREEGGTPNVLGDIRAAMAMTVKSAVDADWLARRQEQLRQRALRVWRNIPTMKVLGHGPGQAALPIFSLLFRDGTGEIIDPEACCRALSDDYSLQVRGGCSCAGPYGHRLLGIDQEASAQIHARIARNEAVAKPGWVRLSLSPFLSDEKADWIIQTIADFAGKSLRLRGPSPAVGRSIDRVAG